MPRAKKVKAEIVRAPVSVDPETLDRLIQQRVLEALAHQDRALIEPWFQSPQVAYEIRRHQTMFHRRKFSLYYAKWGCLRCRKKSVPHASNGMCQKCMNQIIARLRALEREYAQGHPQEYQQEQIDQLTSRVRNAERILGIVRPVIETPEAREE